MSTSRKLRLAIFISGGGTTMQAVMRACKPRGILSELIEPVLVISDRPSAGGIEKARAEGLREEQIRVVRRKRDDAGEFGDELLRLVTDADVDVIGQFGWMKLTPKSVIDGFAGTMVNQHPGPIDPDGHGDFGGDGMFGMRVHAARLFFVQATERDWWTEATAQYVDPRYDRGALIASRPVPILRDDTPETLKDRVLPVEHETQIEALRLIATGRAQRLDRRGERLVFPHELPILEAAKRRAIELFPHG